MKLSDQEKQQLITVGRSGEHTLQEIGDMFGVSRERGRQILAEAGVTVRRGGKNRHTYLRRKFPPESHAEIRAYAADHGLYAAMAHYRTSAQTLHDWIGVPSMDPKKISDDDLRELSAAGLSGSEICRLLGMSGGTIQLRLRKMGLNGEKSGNYGGGQPTHRAGTGDEVRRLRVEGLSYNQIASRLDISVGTVQHHLGKRPPAPA